MTAPLTVPWSATSRESARAGLTTAPSVAASGSSHRAYVLSTAIVLGLCFLLTEHDPTVSRHNDFSLSAEDMQAEAGGGNAIRRIAFLSIAAWGVAGSLLTATGFFRGTCQPGRHVAPGGDIRSSSGASSGLCGHDPVARPISQIGVSLLTLTIVLLLAWCGLSLGWSHDPGFTLRRLLVLGCLSIGALGLALSISSRDLCRIAILICGSSLLLGLLTEVAIGTFRPWSGGYRFSGTLHPNTQGLYLTTLCTAAYALWCARPRRSPTVPTHSLEHATPPLALGWLAIIAVGLLFLVLTKSRTSTAGVVLSLGTLALLRSRINPVALVALFFGLLWVTAGALVCHLWQIDPLREFKQLLLMGRTDQAESLTGRLPIWTELAPFVAARFWTGFGYDSFWTPEHIDHVSTRVEWGVREAHSAYFESILSIGVPGLGLILAVVLIGLARAGWQFRSRVHPAAGLAAGLLVYGLLNAFTESGMTMPLFPTFLLGAILWQVSLTPLEAPRCVAPTP
jgi:exopolysaccharide production protein ExoQ